jgi:hypothetical protein
MRPTTLFVLAAIGLLFCELPAAVLHATNSQLDRVLEARSVYCEPSIECLWVLSGSLRIRVGIEVVGAGPHARPVPTTAPSPAMTVRELLNRTVTAEPLYEWRETGDLVTVRPREAWEDASNTLNRQIGAPIELSDATLGGALRALCEGRCYTGYGPMRVGAPPFRFLVQFPGGTLLEAINAVVGAHGSAAWRYGHFTTATNVMILGKTAPDEIVRVERLTVRPFDGR